MATTETTALGDGTTTEFSFSFAYLKTEDVRVELQRYDSTQSAGNQIISRTAISGFTIPPGNPTAIQFNSGITETDYQETTGAPKQYFADDSAQGQVRIRIYRFTDADATPATFFSGSSIRAKDLNDNFDQILFIMQERQNTLQTISTGGIGENVINTNQLVDDSVDKDKLKDSATSSERAVTSNHIQDGAVTSARLDTNIDIAGTFDVTGNATFDSNVDIASTGYLKVPSGDTTARNALTPVNGMIRYSTTDSRMEAYVNGSWGEVSRAAGAVGAGGDTVFFENSPTVTTSYTIGQNGAAVKNAVSAGPITIGPSAVVTVPAGQSWVIV